MALKDIKTKIHATERTHKVTRAMEAVSAVKMRKTQDRALRGRSYAQAALSILGKLSTSSDVARHPLAIERSVHRIALVLLTSDKGLAGALNSSVIKAAEEAVSAYTSEQVSVYAYGRKGAEYFARRGFVMVEKAENKKDEVEISVVEELTQTLAEGFTSGGYDEVYIAYSNFKSTFEQVPVVRRLLPLSFEQVRAMVDDIVPEKGKWSEATSFDMPIAYSVEPEPTEVLARLLPRLLAVSIYHAMLEGKASEHSARMVAMKNASDKSKEVAHDLTRLFNKIRQAGITREVSEIVGGREALAT